MKYISLSLILLGFISCGNSNSQEQTVSTENTVKEQQTDEVAYEIEVTTEEEVLAENTEEKSITEEVVEEKPISNLKPQTSNLKPQTSNPKPKTSNPKPQTENSSPKEEPLAVKEPEVTNKPNHYDWNELTKKYVNSNGKVNYKGFKTDLDKLKAYLDYLGNHPVEKEWSKNEELAYWFNLYNASTVYLIVSNYPTKSITNLEGGKPWDKKFVKSGDKTYSLNDIENVIVRPKFNEPLVHVAFNCAAVSCPSLLNEAFVADKLYSQLNKQAKNWVNDATKNELTTDKVKVSQLFDWYKADFKSSGGVIAFINKYADTKVNEEAKVSYLEYEWKLNE